MPAKRQTTARDLIAQLSQNLQIQTPSAAEEGGGPKNKVSAPAQDQNKSVSQGRKTGETASFWLDDEDRQIFQEISMHLYSQGIKPTNNLIFRAALRLMGDGQPLLDKVRELMASDGRVLRHKKIEIT